MCDYSLMEFPNRLAKEGEILVVHRFHSGSLGLASPEDRCRTEAGCVSTKTFWGALKEFFHPSEIHVVKAVCIPPGARLVLHDLPIGAQKALALGPDEEVTFVQLSAAANSYRDAVRFRTGQLLRLQELREGQRVEVIDLGFEATEQPDLSENTEFLPVVGGVRRI